MFNPRLERTLDFIRKKNAKGRSRWVYVIKCGEFYKVGIADNVKHRLGDLQNASPYHFELVKAWQCLDARKQEREIHRLCWRFHERGEWFKLPIECVLAFGSTESSPIEALKAATKKAWSLPG